MVFKYWQGIASSCLNDMFMPSVNNHNTRSQIALDIPLCRTIKGQKNIPFLGPKIWNKNIKTAATAFTHRLKKEILRKLQERAILQVFLLLYLLFFLFIYLFNLLKVNCFIFY